MKLPRNNRQFDLVIVGIVTLGLAVALLWAGLRPGYVLLPLDIVTQGWPPWQEPNQPVNVHNFLLADVVDYIIPVKVFMAETIRAGQFPLWNPYVMAGYPFTYNTQAGVFYPFSLLYYLLPVDTAVNLTIVGQLLLGGLFMALYLRRWVRSRWAVLLGVVIFLFNGHMVVWLEWQVVHAAIIWLPLQLHLADILGDHWRQSPRQTRLLLRSGVGLALAFAVPWLGGHWNWTLYNALLLAAYLFWRSGGMSDWWRWLRRKTAVIQPLQSSMMLAAVLGLGGLITAVQTLPAFHFLSQSHRLANTFANTLSYGLLDRAVVLLLPNFFGNSVANNWWGPAFSNDVETAFYPGVMALFLACLALALRRDGVTRFFVGWGALSLLWAWGTPLYGLLYAVPQFRGLSPSRAAFMVPVCVAVLASLALDVLLARGKGENGRFLWRLAWGIGGLFLLFVVGYGWYFRAGVAAHWQFLWPYLALFLFLLVASVGWVGLWRRRAAPWLLGGLALLLTVFDLFAFGYGYNTASPMTDFYPAQPIEDFFQQDSELFRLVTLAEGVVYPPNTALMPRLPNLSGYEPGLPRRLVNYLEVAEGESVIRHGRFMLPFKGITSPLLAALNVKYIPTVSDVWSGEPAVGAVQETAAIWRPLPIHIPLTLPEAGFFRLDVPLRRGEGDAGVVTARILSADGVQEFAHAEIAAAEIAASSWTSFYFSAFPSEWGREFLAEVAFSGADGQVLVGADAAGQPAFTAYYLPRPALVYEDKKTRVYLNEGYMPRAFVVNEAVTVADEAAALAALAAQPDAVARRVLLELEGQPTPPALAAAGNGDSIVTITDYGLNQVVLRAEMAAPGFVVLADMAYPGWRAAVDGEETAVYRANSIMRAVYVPAGTHEIRFAFRPPDFMIGAGLSGLGLLICLIVLVGSFQSGSLGFRGVWRET
ncbi:MAG: YfhO family protein [Anaerolineaceae bacterium]|nr:YfhO family protein [Anaerolineaceae bacterium]